MKTVERQVNDVVMRTVVKVRSFSFPKEERDELHRIFVAAKEQEAERHRSDPDHVCERCRCWSEETGFHDYWPIYRLCPDCVQILLDVHFPPFIVNPGREGTDPKAEDFCHICADEKEWHRLTVDRAAESKPVKVEGPK